MGIPSAYDIANGTIDNTVIVSSNGIVNTSTGINIVDIQERKISKYVPIESYCYGLVERDGHVIFCSEPGMKILNLHTETVSTITTKGVSSTSFIDTNVKNIYYTTYFGNSVTCCDFQGAIKWTFKDDTILKNPQGISVDENGFSFVLSNDSVVLISPCGKQHKTILSSNDGLRDAQALHYDKARNILLVANKEEKAFLYKINRN
ncbi:ERN1 [Mytilus edulis]|uniref:ERN1 n=1 Tax=Mytilus edulis TaxID=6550 RepID=A0A8S3VJP8_MYTED|nr:ERN1 [Mytilus edulis]